MTDREEIHFVGYCLMIVILFLIIPLINDSKEERTRIEKLEKQVEYQQILIEELREQK